MKRIGFAAAALMGLVLASSEIARGDMVITATDLADLSNVTTTLNGFPTPTLRSITLNGSTTNFGVNVTGSDRVDATDDFLSTNSIDVNNNSSSTETLHIVVTDKFNTLANLSGLLTSTLTLQNMGNPATFFGNPNDSVSFFSTLGISTPSTQGTGNPLPLGYFAPLVGTPFTFALATSGNAPFTLMATIDVTLAAGDHVNLNAVSQFNAVPIGANTPEPSRIVGILGIAGMLGLGLVWKRRRDSPALQC